MRGSRSSLPSALVLAGAAGGTTWCALLSWRGFTEQSARFLAPLLLLAVVVAVSGAVARWARTPATLVVLVQVLLSGALASSLLVGSALPVGDAWLRLQDEVSDAVSTAQQYAAPVPATADGGVHLLLVAGGLACLLLVDLLACTLRRVSLAGLPLLAIYSVPVSLLPAGVPWWVFTATAGGFLLMLFLQVDEQLARWGRQLGDAAISDPSGFGVRTGAIRTSAGAIGAVSTALALFLPLLIPTLDLNLLTGGTGPGGGDIAIENPMVDLRRDLQRGDDLPLVRVRTDDPDPSYLRIAVLNRFTDNEWRSGDREVPTHQLADGAMPALQGVAGTVARTEVRYDVTVSPGFRSIWLPTQAPVSAVDAPGDWRYDLATMDFLSADDGLMTAGLRYSMTAVELDLSAQSMARAVSSGGQVSNDFLELPDGIPPEITNIAFQVTRNEPTRFEKAQALQEWFREDGGFTYDLDSAEGNGTDDLLRFLTEGEGGKTGYCEQFAAAMAVLARAVGIPARVAVGFLEPENIGPATWQYSAWDLHAWPELFFPGAGWVRFEPTPPGRASGVPGYTTQRVDTPDSTGVPAAPRQGDELPGRAESTEPSPSETAGAWSDDGAGSSFPWLPVLGTAGGLGLAGLMLLVPRTVRRARARRRRGAGPEAAWAELRDTTVDLAVPWPSDRSPRETRDRLVGHLGVPVGPDTPARPVHGPHVAPDAVTALDTIVLAVERLRYARSQDRAVPPLTAELETVVASLHGGATRRARRRAAWWPRSVLGGRQRRSRFGGEPLITVRSSGVVDHVG